MLRLARTQFDFLSAGFARKGDVISQTMSEIGGFAIDQALTVKKPPIHSPAGEPLEPAVRIDSARACCSTH